MWEPQGWGFQLLLDDDVPFWRSLRWLTRLKVGAGKMVVASDLEIGYPWWLDPALNYYSS